MLFQSCGPQLLIVGPPASGKSTILRQLQLQYEGLPTALRNSFRDDIIFVIIDTMHRLIDLAFELDVEIDPKLYKDESIVVSYKWLPGKDIPFHVAQSIERLWQSKAIRDCYRELDDIGHCPNADYFLSNCIRLAIPKCEISVEDVLSIYVPSERVDSLDLTIGGQLHRFYEIPGNMRWFKQAYHFSDVTAVLFVASLASFNLYHEETERNMLLEAILLFKELESTKYLISASILLFLNQMDLFERKLESYEISDYFLDYEGPNEPLRGAVFIGQLFKQQVVHRHRKAYIHMTTATQTSRLKIQMSSLV
ncbi:guanine nucleotide binding protein, alpha subunit [Gorgonomyces haynaldii]|nr:guanine nucleotide binding protein, alpha subunit [Gorgonomyces haynaldii]